jgi:hypothetical protein
LLEIALGSRPLPATFVPYRQAFVAKKLEVRMPLASGLCLHNGSTAKALNNALAGSGMDGRKGAARLVRHA